MKKRLTQLKHKVRNGLSLLVSFRYTALTLLGVVLLVTALVILIRRPEVTVPFVEDETDEVVEVEEERQVIFGVMIENAYDAWPLSGLEEAFLVIEAPVEGDIPRFIAFFKADQETKKIGPVRSARPYYIDYASEFGAIYAHVGGSPEALEKVRATDVVQDLDQFFESEYFYRQTTGGRYAPHNVFTSMESLRGAIDEFSVTEFAYGLWKRKAGESRGNLSLRVNQSLGVYRVLWRYNPSTNNYVRLQGDRVMTVENGKRVIVDAVVVIETDVRSIDDLGRKAVTTIGDGYGLLAQDGVVEEITWKKPSAEERLRFYDETGKEVAINTGRTWIHVVDTLESATAYEELQDEVSPTDREEE